MNPGDLKQIILFHLPDNEKDDEGFRIENPKPIIYTKARAKLKTLKGKTFYAAAQHNMEHNREFTIRFQKILEDGIRPKSLTVQWKGINHEIVSIENDNGLNKTMTVVVKAVG